MEEIDTIIIESLKNLHCDIDDNIISLKQFDPDLTLTSITTCIETILTDIKLPKKYPPSMATKLKIATTVAQQLKDLGFRDDVGYQTILYSNETEIRRVLMFLIERLPRETNKIIHIEPTGYVPQLIKDIEQKIKNSLEQFWLPTNVLYKGCRQIDNSYLVHSTGDCGTIQAKKLKIPTITRNHSEIFKQYWNRNVPEVTKQCKQNELISSLLFDDFIITTEFPSLINGGGFENIDNSRIIDNITMEEPSQLQQRVEIVEESVGDLEKFVGILKTKQEEFTKLKETLRNNEIKLSQVNTMKCDEEKVLKDTLTKIDLKTKTLAILNKEENLIKLKNLVEANNNKLVILANQWNEIQTPLLDEYKSLQNTLLDQDNKIQQEQAKLKKSNDNYESLLNDLKEKTLLEEQLRRKIELINKKHNRSGYTRRIFEIISNIKKQNNEIDKILKDTKQVQKEINTLTGQVDRSFTLSDEIIFQDAKQDETSRKAYKLLVELHDECASIIKAINDLGLVERESRNLQDQIDFETLKDIKTKLEKVNHDLDEIYRETELLLKNKK